MPWNWHRPITPEFITPPAEKAVSEVQQLAELRSRHDAALRLLDERISRTPYGGADDLLDIRLVLAPPPPLPVVPGPDIYAEDLR